MSEPTPALLPPDPTTSGWHWLTTNGEEKRPFWWGNGGWNVDQFCVETQTPERMHWLRWRYHAPAPIPLKWEADPEEATCPLCDARDDEMCGGMDGERCALSAFEVTPTPAPAPDAIPEPAVGVWPAPRRIGSVWDGVYGERSE